MSVGLVKILVVNNDQDDLKNILINAFPDSEIRFISTETTAIKLAQSENPDVILLDIGMPGMDGLTVCRKLKAQPGTSHIPVVFVTASRSNHNHRIEALEAGAEGFLSKPLDESELTAQIRAMVKIKRANEKHLKENEQLAELASTRTRELEEQLAVAKQSRQALHGAFEELKNSQRATLNLLEDLKNEIESRKQTEHALRESETNLKKAQKVAKLGSWLWHIPENRLEWSKQMYEIFGLSPQDFTGNWDDVIASVIHPDDREAHGQASIEVFNNNTPQSMEYRIVLPDGTQRVVWDEPGDLVLDEQGRPLSLSGITQDVTDRVGAEEQLRLQAAALETAANAIVITDRDGTIEWVNPAYERLTGYSAAEAIGQNPRLLKSGVQDQSYYQAMWDAILAGRVWQGELVNRRKDGSLYTEEEIITPLLSTAGVISHFIGIKQDITRRKLAEAESHRFTELLVQINQAGRAMSETLDTDPLFQRLSEAVHNLLPDICGHFVLLYDTRSEQIRVAAGHCNERFVDLEEIQPFLLDHNGQEPVSEVILKGQPLILPDLKTASYHYSESLIRCTTSAARSAVFVPMFAEGNLVGVLLVQSYTLSRFTDADVTLLTLLSNTAAAAIVNATLHQETEENLRKLTVLRTIDQTINNSFDLTFTLNTLVEQTALQLKVDAVSVLLLDQHSLTLEFAAGSGFKLPNIELVRLRLGESQAGRAVLEMRTLCTPDLSAEDISLSSTPLAKGEKIVSYHVTPLIAKGQVLGVMEVFNHTRLEPDDRWIDFFETLANQAAIAINNAQLFEGLQRSNLNLAWAYDATIEGWSRAMDLRDHETEGHTQRVTNMTMHFARAVGIESDHWVHIRRGALLHDIGKLGVPDHILLKPGKLSAEEWEIMIKHPQYANEMLYPIEYLRPALDIPYCHHEKWDGTGYPRGLKGEEIPFAARMFAFVDVFDAVTSDRPYRKAWTREQALEYIAEQAGKHFDPGLVDKFIDINRENISW